MTDRDEIEKAIGEWAVNLTPGQNSHLSLSSTPKEIGAALSAIRDKRLYRQQFTDFYLYCARRFGMRPHRVRWYIAQHEGVNLQRKAEEHRETTVYFLAGNGMVKIGYTTDLSSRVKSIQNMSPIPLVLMLAIKGNKATEREIHERFASLRRHGEWFELTSELIAFISNIAEVQS